MSGQKQSPYGCPVKYADLLLQLPDDEVFSPAGIARFGVDTGYFGHLTPDETAVVRKRIRLSLGRLSKTRAFPKNGDELVSLPGQPPTPGWYGWRWKYAVA